MKYYSKKLVFKDVPEEVSLALEITGCPLRCKGCHSPHLRNHKLGEPLTPEVFDEMLWHHKGTITCVVFMGGEWYEDQLIELLDIAIAQGLKTCLYTGQSVVSHKIYEKLNYLKTGRYIEEFGGLESPTTNQKFIRIK